MQLKKVFSNLYYNRVIKNVFKTNQSRKALLSYTTTPFLNFKPDVHNNHQESLAIAEVLDSFNFSVDVMNYLDERDVDFSQYSLIFGFGEPLVNSFKQNGKQPLRIYYGTGCHVSHQNQATLSRINQVYKKTGCWMLDSSRLVTKTWTEQTSLVDGMVLLGNEFVADTYRQFYDNPDQIYQQPVSCMATRKTNIISRDISRAKKRFMWFGSAGAVHKGLDLLLEAFAELPHLELHICGNLNREKTFMDYYQHLLNKKNVYYHGFIRVGSAQYKELLKKCLFTTLPSCSEGQPGSVINVMAEGLIPIVPASAGINPNNFVISLADLTTKEIKNTLIKATKIDNETLEVFSQQCLTSTRSKHSISAYKKSLKSSLKQIFNHYDL